MVYLNVQAIIDNYQLDRDLIALLLFPENKFPKTALFRITTEESVLTSEQVYALADFIGVTVDELYSFGPSWVQQYSTKKDIIIFKRGSYVVNVNTRTGVVSIQEAARPINYLKAIVNKSITFEELFSIVDSYILNNMQHV